MSVRTKLVLGAGLILLVATGCDLTGQESTQVNDFADTLIAEENVNRTATARFIATKNAEDTQSAEEASYTDTPTPTATATATATPVPGQTIEDEPGDMQECSMGTMAPIGPLDDPGGDIQSAYIDNSIMDDYVMFMQMYNAFVDVVNETYRMSVLLDMYGSGGTPSGFAAYTTQQGEVVQQGLYDGTGNLVPGSESSVYLSEDGSTLIFEIPSDTTEIHLSVYHQATSDSPLGCDFLPNDGPFMLDTNF